jgi:hypothetical protein
MSIYKNLIALLCFTLLSACAVKYNTAQDIPWLLQFRYKRDYPKLPAREILSLNGTIPYAQIEVSQLRTDINESQVITVKYKEVPKALVQKVYNQLKEDDSIELLGMSQGF